VYILHKIKSLDKDLVCPSVCHISEITGCNSVTSAITSDGLHQMSLWEIYFTPEMNIWLVMQEISTHNRIWIWPKIYNFSWMLFSVVNISSQTFRDSIF